MATQAASSEPQQQCVAPVRAVPWPSLTAPFVNETEKLVSYRKDPEKNNLEINKMVTV